MLPGFIFNLRASFGIAYCTQAFKNNMKAAHKYKWVGV